jgi:hypothetical protein
MVIVPPYAVQPAPSRLYSVASQPEPPGLSAQLRLTPTGWPLHVDGAYGDPAEVRFAGVVGATVSSSQL